MNEAEQLEIAKARTRAALLERCRTGVLWSAAIYVTVMATNALNFWRSLSFTVGGACALVLLVAGWRGRAERIPSPGWPLLLSLGAWTLWSVLSVAWSVQPYYSWLQVKGDVLWSAVVAFMVYTAVRDAHAWRMLVGLVLASLAALGAFAIGLELSPAGWDPGRWHVGPGGWTTYIVLVAPFLVTIIAPPPVGIVSSRRRIGAVLVLIAILLVTGRIADNRMVWIALAAVVGVLGVLVARRWRAGALDLRVVRFAVVLVLFGIFAALFADTAREKAESFYPRHTTIAETLEHDPRIGLWQRIAAHIEARPWHGYGVGRAILSKELRAELHDPLLWHAHNLFASQWLQVGAIGLAAFVAMFGALVLKYRAFYRSGNDAVSLLGAMGLALIAGFVVKNLTDDFMFQHNAKQFWVLNALLLGYGMRLRATEK